ncbi:unnamed protein product [Caenorhabditis auriculariae]|uniref:Uncharacterized protein n=1 Tax=Caenorhabditis auriculariae TaxID=2777116 RepID=A0A8S1H3I3_9PELO|nr:unnamed protein product [Caenorhabditis auriculariae]
MRTEVNRTSQCSGGVLVPQTVRKSQQPVQFVGVSRKAAKRLFCRIALLPLLAVDRLSTVSAHKLWTLQLRIVRPAHLSPSRLPLFMLFLFMSRLLVPFVFAVFVNSIAANRIPRSTAFSNLSEGTSNILGDLINAINPVYVVIIGCLIAAGCAFELAYGSRPARTTTHVASRNAPFALSTA